MAFVRLSEDATVRGAETWARDHPATVYTFKGVPYAQPPLGPLRLRPPQTLELWTGERDATEYGESRYSSPLSRWVDVETVMIAGAISPQDMTSMKIIPHKCLIPEQQSEDCLVLNIWTPSLDPTANKAVMVWIHGGGFVGGKLANTLANC
jgi:carboxylesterase type B